VAKNTHVKHRETPWFNKLRNTKKQNSEVKQTLTNHIKNLGGWTTKRKILCFAVDDYGNVRLHSKNAFDSLKNKGVNLKNRFDHFDALDTKDDFLQLYDVLNSVKDQHQNPAIFTPYALSANINFDKVLQEKNQYEYELLPETYQKLAKENKAYQGAWELLQEGIQNKFIKPQFHGREHLNINLFNDLLKQNHPHFIANLKHCSYAGIPQNPKKPTIKFTQAFAFWDEKDILEHKKIIENGLKCFETVYGYKPSTFTPPAQQLHPELFQFIENLGIKAIDKPRQVKRHLGQNNFKKEHNKLGIQKNQNHITIVRNAVFEPTEPRNINWVDFAFKQIQAAFRTHKPAIVSSHRVNYCGHISAQNRTKGLNALKHLLNKVTTTYPDVEFLAVDELVNEIIKTSSKSINIKP